MRLMYLVLAAAIALVPGLAVAQPYNQFPPPGTPISTESPPLGPVIQSEARTPSSTELPQPVPVIVSEAINDEEDDELVPLLGSVDSRTVLAAVVGMAAVVAIAANGGSTSGTN